MKFFRNIKEISIWLILGFGVSSLLFGVFALISDWYIADILFISTISLSLLSIIPFIISKVVEDDLKERKRLKDMTPEQRDLYIRDKRKKEDSLRKEVRRSDDEWFGIIFILGLISAIAIIFMAVFKWAWNYLF